MPIFIEQDTNWDGNSVDPKTGKSNPNKTTAMDWDEHVTILTNARGLVASSAAPTAFDDLRLAYGHAETMPSGVKIIVLKGIHQPQTNPHMKIQTCVPVSGSAPRYEKYHLNVSAKPAPADKGLDDKFTWVGVQFTHGDHGQNQYPVGAPITMKEPATVLTRRNSISSKDFASHLAQIQAEEAAAAKAQALLEQFEVACTDFEKAHGLQPIDRAIRTAKSTGWVKPTYTGTPKVAGGPVVKFNYDPIQIKFTKLP